MMLSLPEYVLNTRQAWPRNRGRHPAAPPIFAGVAARSPAQSVARSARIPLPPAQHHSSSPAALKEAAPPPGSLPGK